MIPHIPFRFWDRGWTLCARLHAELALRIAEADVAGAAKASDQLLDYVESFTRLTVSPNRAV